MFNGVHSPRLETNIKKCVITDTVNFLPEEDVHTSWSVCLITDKKKRNGDSRENPENEPLSEENPSNDTHAPNGSVQLGVVSNAHGENSSSGEWGGCDSEGRDY